MQLAVAVVLAFIATEQVTVLAVVHPVHEAKVLLCVQLNRLSSRIVQR